MRNTILLQQSRDRGLADPDSKLIEEVVGNRALIKLGAFGKKTSNGLCHAVLVGQWLASSFLPVIYAGFLEFLESAPDVADALVGAVEDTCDGMQVWMFPCFLGSEDCELDGGDRVFLEGFGHGLSSLLAKIIVKVHWNLLGLFIRSLKSCW